MCQNGLHLKDFASTVLDNDVLLSMDGKGRCMDNIFIERLWRSVKYEEIYIKEYDSIGELVKSLKIYFEFYNNERTHAGLVGKTPAEVYFGHFKLQMAA
jgi:putative transposase